MSSRAAVYFRRAVFVPLVLLSGAAAAAGPLAGLTQPGVGTSSFAAAPTAVNSLPVVVPSDAGLPSAAAVGNMNLQSSAALPGLDGLADNQRKQSAVRSGTTTNSIRPIRVPPNVLPIVLPVATGS